MATESLADKLKRGDVKETVLKTVQLDGQAVLKIMKHCNESLPQLVTGQLLGLDVGQTLEVTDCFPFPSTAGDDATDQESAGASYQLDMMRCLREVNVDNNTVGWYQSTILGSYQTVELIETFVNYYENIKKCVCIVYDPQRAARGSPALKAIRLKDTFIAKFKEGKLTLKDMREAALGWKDVFQEIPIKIHNSTLVQALVTELAHDSVANQGDYDRLNLGVAPFLEKNLESLLECVDDLVSEQQKVSLYHRNSARMEQQKAIWLQKRKQENAARRAAGEEPLPEEDPVLHKPIPELSQLDNYLITNQINNFCEQISAASANGLQKLYVAQALQAGAGAW